MKKLISLLIISFCCGTYGASAQDFSSNLTEEREFLKSNKSVSGVKSSATGLQYIISSKGKGRKPTMEDEVYVKYVGKFIDGTIFDSHTDSPAVFKMNGIIQGMSEGLKMICPGGKITLFIPSDLGYGPKGAGAIPGNKLLIFEVELLDVYNEAKD